MTSGEPKVPAGAGSGEERLTRAEAAGYLGIGGRRLRRLIDEGQLVANPRRRDLEAYLAKVRIEPGSLGHLCMWDRYAKSGDQS
jgi:hypothetical protein